MGETADFSRIPEQWKQMAIMMAGDYASYKKLLPQLQLPSVQKDVKTLYSMDAGKKILSIRVANTDSSESSGISRCSEAMYSFGRTIATSNKLVYVGQLKEMWKGPKPVQQSDVWMQVGKQGFTMLYVNYQHMAMHGDHQVNASTSVNVVRLKYADKMLLEVMDSMFSVDYGWDSNLMEMIRKRPEMGALVKAYDELKAMNQNKAIEQGLCCYCTVCGRVICFS